MKSDILKRVGIWGHPWHGLVKSGTLTLPNGQQVAYPQPVGGDTHLLAVPGVQPVERTPDELIEDAAAGRQWWTAVTLSGRQSQLYSKPLGAGRWIYVDPDGVRWLVSTSLNNNAADIQRMAQTITLARFGEFYGAPEVHTYSVPALYVGQDYPEVFSSESSPLEPGAILGSLFSTHPSGQAAAFVLTAVYAPVNRINPLRPVGWLELTLSGPGGACSVQLGVLHTRAATLGEVTNTRLDTASYWTLDEVRTSTKSGGFTGPDCSGTRTDTITLVPRSYPQFHDGLPKLHDYSQHGPESAAYTRSVVGWVYAVWYDPSGVKKQLYFDAIETGSWQAPELAPVLVPSVRVVSYKHIGGTTCDESGVDVLSRWSVQIAGTVHQEVSYRLVLRDDSGELSAVDVSVVLDFGMEYEVKEGPQLGSRLLQSRRRYGTELLTYPGVSGPEEITHSWDGTNYENEYGGDYGRYVPAGIWPQDSGRVHTDAFMVHGIGLYGIELGHEVYFYAAPVAYANNAVGFVHGIRRRSDTDYAITHVGRLATPSGAVDCPPISYSTPVGSVVGSSAPAVLVSASWCPVTERVAMATSPVAFV